jgi:hypothetical protein
VLLLPAAAFAGGPPWLCLPIDGVNAENAQEAADLLASKLADKIWQSSDEQQPVKIRQHEQQWYLTFYMGNDIKLSDVRIALLGSKFDVASNRLHLFGHVDLLIDPKGADRQKLLRALDAVDYVSIAESTDKDSQLLVTLDLPYPAGDNEIEHGAVGWKEFRRNDLSTDQEARSKESPATPDALPHQATLAGVVQQNGAVLKEIRWTTTYACRALGGVAVPNTTLTVKK